jgi:hypothetical protein
MRKVMPAPTTMTRPAMARVGAVDSVLLGPGTTPRQLDDQDAVERSRRHAPSRPRLRKRESTSGACSATKFLSADSSRRREARAVAAKLSRPEHAELKD